MDTQAQSLPRDAPTKPIVFASAAYFDLVEAHPEAAAWLALGRQVEFVLDQTLVQIGDDQ